MAPTIETVISRALFALVISIIPVLVWLWYWEHEDKNPEPHRLILWAFLGGMIAVVTVIPFQSYARTLGFSMTALFVIWAAIEEVMKFAWAYITTLWRAENDEPIDSMMYMIVTALGFAALETALFIFTPLLQSNTPLVLVTLNLRFFGATIIHTICSSIIGFSLALSFYRGPIFRYIHTFLALLLAITLHSLFNLFIMDSNRTAGVIALYVVWIGLVAILLLFEKVKQIKQS
jgi:RsiW-degrading membrane proteinase PrsW (M82 family)